MIDKDKQKIMQNLATQMQVAQDTIKQVEEELKKLGVSSSDLPEPKLQDLVQPGSQDSIGKIIEGQFDGQNMIGPDGKVYPVVMRRVLAPQELDEAWLARLTPLGSSVDSSRPDHWWSFNLESTN